MRKIGQLYSSGVKWSLECVKNGEPDTDWQVSGESVLIQAIISWRKKGGA